MSEDINSQTEHRGAGLGAWPVGAGGGAEGLQGLSVEQRWQPRAGAAVTAGPCGAAGCPGPALLPVLL